MPFSRRHNLLHPFAFGRFRLRPPEPKVPRSNRGEAEARGTVASRFSANGGSWRQIPASSMTPGRAAEQNAELTCSIRNRRRRFLSSATDSETQSNRGCLRLAATSYP